MTRILCLCLCAFNVVFGGVTLCSRKDAHGLEQWKNRNLFLTVGRCGTMLTVYCMNNLIKDPEFKAQHFHYLPIFEKIDKLNNNLLVITRNYKEVLLRFAKSDSYNQKSLIQYLEQDRNYLPYLKILQWYDQWNPKRRLLIYYEDLLDDPKKVLETILDFYKQPKDKLDHFIQNWSLHSRKMLAMYNKKRSIQGVSMSRGKSMTFHSQDLPTEVLQAADKKMQALAGPLWDKYLKRYQTQVVILRSRDP